MIRRPPRSTLFPYTPRSRSVDRPSFAAADVVLVVVDVTADRREVVVVRVGDDVVHRGPQLTVHAYRRVDRSEEHTSELQSRQYLVCRLLLEKKQRNKTRPLL